MEEIVVKVDLLVISIVVDSCTIESNVQRRIFLLDALGCF